MTAECVNPKVVLALIRVSLLLAILILLAVGAGSRQLTRATNPHEFFSFTSVGLSDGVSVWVGDFGCTHLQSSYRVALSMSIGCIVLTFALLVMAIVIGVLYERHLYRKRERFLENYTEGLKEIISRRCVVRREAERNWYRNWYKESVGNGSRREEFFARRARLSAKERDREDAWLLAKRKQETDSIVDRTLAYPPLPFYLERADVYAKAEHDLQRKHQQRGKFFGGKTAALSGRGDLVDPVAALTMVGDAVGDAVVRVGNIFNTIIDLNEVDDKFDFVFVEASDVVTPQTRIVTQRSVRNGRNREGYGRFEYNDADGDWVSDIYASIGAVQTQNRNQSTVPIASHVLNRTNVNMSRPVNIATETESNVESGKAPVAGITPFFLRYATKLIYVLVSFFAILLSLITWAVTADFYNNSWCGRLTPKFEDFRYDNGFICLVVAFCLHTLAFVIYILESSAKRGTELLQLSAIEKVKSAEYNTGNGFGVGMDTVGGSEVGAAKDVNSARAGFRGSDLLFFKSFTGGVGDDAPIVGSARTVHAGIFSIADFALRFGDSIPAPRT